MCFLSASSRSSNVCRKTSRRPFFGDTAETEQPRWASGDAHLQLLSEVTKSWSLGRRWQSDGEEDYRLTSLLKQQQFVLPPPHKNARAVARTEILIIPTLTLRFYWKRGMWVKRVGDISIVLLFYLNNSYSIQQCTDGKKRREEEDRKWAKWVKWYPPISSLIRFHWKGNISRIFFVPSEEHTLPVLALVLSKRCAVR